MGSLVISVGYIYQWWWKIWTFWEAIALHDTSHWEFSEIQDHQSKPWKQKIFRNSGQRHRRCGLILKKLSKFNTPTVCQWISLCPPLLVGCACHTFALFFSFALGGLCSTAPPLPTRPPFYLLEAPAFGVASYLLIPSVRCGVRIRRRNGASGGRPAGRYPMGWHIVAPCRLVPGWLGFYVPLTWFTSLIAVNLFSMIYYFPRSAGETGTSMGGLWVMGYGL